MIDEYLKCPGQESQPVSEWTVRQAIGASSDQMAVAVGSDFEARAAREAAEKELADELILERLGSSAPRTTDKTPVMDLVYRYAEAKADDVAKPKLLADAIEALSPFWGTKTAADINRESCAEYTKWRIGGGLRKHHLKTRAHRCRRRNLAIDGAARPNYSQSCRSLCAGRRNSSRHHAKSRLAKRDARARPVSYP